MKSQKVKILLSAIKKLGKKGIDMNKENEENKLKVKLLEETFKDLLSAIKDKNQTVNINEKSDEIVRQLDDFRVHNVKGMGKILPQTYEKDIFVIPEVTEQKVGEE